MEHYTSTGRTLGAPRESEQLDVARSSRAILLPTCNPTPLTVTNQRATGEELIDLCFRDVLVLMGKNIPRPALPEARVLTETS